MKDWTSTGVAAGFLVQTAGRKHASLTPPHPPHPWVSRCIYDEVGGDTTSSMQKKAHFGVSLSFRVATPTRGIRVQPSFKLDDFQVPPGPPGVDRGWLRGRFAVRPIQHRGRAARDLEIDVATPVSSSPPPTAQPNQRTRKQRFNGQS